MPVGIGFDMKTKNPTSRATLLGDRLPNMDVTVLTPNGGVSQRELMVRSLKTLNQIVQNARRAGYSVLIEPTDLPHSLL